MKNIQIEKISDTYTVRTITEADVPMLYAWMQRNDQYYRYCGGETSPGRIRQDLTLCPPGIPLAQKYYVGFFAAGTLVAVMDLVDGYPDADTAFIGFFMMNKSLQGRGVGTALVSEVLAYLTALGFAAVRLGIDKARSLAALLEHLGLTREQMVCMGDGYNDQTMIEFAGMGVAMANAQEPVRKVADYVTCSNDEDGVAEAVEHLFFGK